MLFFFWGVRVATSSIYVIKRYDVLNDIVDFLLFFWLHDNIPFPLPVTRWFQINGLIVSWFPWYICPIWRPVFVTMVAWGCVVMLSFHFVNWLLVHNSETTTLMLIVLLTKEGIRISVFLSHSWIQILTHLMVPYIGKEII